MSTVQSVERAFAVLRCLGSGPAGVSEIAERTGLPKSTVSRLLATLAELDAVVQIDPNGAYGLGELILDLSASATPGRNLVGTARPVLEDLVEQLGEAAGHRRARRAERVLPRPGQRRPRGAGARLDG